MSDVEFIQQLNNVTDPAEACRVLVENENFLGYDPYYRDLREALIEMCTRCGGTACTS